MVPPIVAVALDIDGVLTDGTIALGPGDEVIRRVAFLDIMGVSRARQAGIRFALISGEGGESVQRIAAKFGVTDLWERCKDKAGAVREFSERAGVPLSQICFVGDDINDVDAMELVGLAASPAGAHRSARAAANWHLKANGGAGAVRELIDTLTDAAWDPQAVLSTIGKR
jgi:3-deoxy-D-manno-octulosonate 8-phosphate phosphatase (KDO 8-P phosphatase)